MPEITGVTNAPQGVSQSNPAGTLGKDDFLMLLTAQLRYQNPLSPIEDAAFIAQMAQFSSLEQMNNIAAGMERLSFSSQVSEAVSLIGRTVTWVEDEVEVSGAVDSVTIEDGAIQLHVGEDSISPAQVRRVN